MTAPDPFFQQVMLKCEAKVGGRTVEVRQVVVAAAYDESEDFRDMIHEGLRRQLMEAILEKWTPVVHVRR